MNNGILTIFPMVFIVAWGKGIMLFNLNMKFIRKLLILISFILLNLYFFNMLSANELLNIDQIRKNVRNYIDELYYYEPIQIKHTTKSEGVPLKILFPEKPKPFDAGRFKIVFKKNRKLKAIICQTESVVGHFNNVVPGVTNVGGYILLLIDPRNDFGDGEKLNSAELDYFIKIIYKKFNEPIDTSKAQLLNKIKDIALAIMFSEKAGIDEYHANQIEKLKSKLIIPAQPK